MRSGPTAFFKHIYYISITSSLIKKDGLIFNSILLSTFVPPKMAANNIKYLMKLS